MAGSLPQLELLFLHRDGIREVLRRHDMWHVRVCGLAAKGMALAAGVPVELLVDVVDARYRAAIDLHEAAGEIASMIGHPVVVIHCRPGEEQLLDGEDLRSL